MGTSGSLKQREDSFQAQQELRKLRKIHIPFHACTYLLPEENILYYAIVCHDWIRKVK